MDKISLRATWLCRLLTTLVVAGVASHAAVATAAKTTAAAGAKKPNILFILTDDRGYGDLSGTGHPYLKTPHMDQIGKDGVRLENFHVAPSCSPTRAGLQTGMHEFKSGVTHTVSRQAGVRPVRADAVTPSARDDDVLGPPGCDQRKSQGRSS